MASSGNASRRLALDVLARIEEDGAYANLALAAALDSSRLDDRDRAFATTLVYGTTRRQRALDHVIDGFLMRPVTPGIRRLLRLGAYQLLDLGTPAHAAVSTTVDQSPRKVRGLVNAVLRKVAKVDEATLAWPSDAVRLSYPDWIVDRVTSEWGADGTEALERMNDPATATVRDDGYVQDPASGFVVDVLEPSEAQTVIDLCAGPGGKATLAAGRGAYVIAADSSVPRAGLVAANADKTGVADRLACLASDGRQPPLRAERAQAVLVDAPCSGLGVLRRRADARWRVEPTDVDDLAALQAELVDAAASLVAPGGRLVYSVCTLTVAETTGVAGPLDDRLITTGWTRVSLDADRWRIGEVGGQVLPQDHDTDAMYVAAWDRPA